MPEKRRGHPKIVFDTQQHKYDTAMLSNMTEPEPEPETRMCACCLNTFILTEWSKHYDLCRSKNTIPAIVLRRNQHYIYDGKKYKISEVDHVYRRNHTRRVNAILVRLYCEEDQTTIRHAFRWDQRFRVDQNNDIWIR
jgi:hypothetical protein